MTTRIRWLLVVSLALNLIFATALGTWLLTHRLHAASTPISSPGFPSPRALHRHLNETERSALRAALESRRDLFREQAREARRARRDVERALLAEPFERAALDDALQRVRAHSGGLAEHAQKAIVELAASMDAEGRQRLATALRHSGKHERGREHGERESRSERERAAD